MPPIQKTFGQGAIGPKSAQLLDIKSAAEKAGLHTLPQVSYTPQFFRNFLERSGALGAKTPKDAQECIMNAQFNQEELKDMAESLLFLCKDDITSRPKLRSLIVRSDESSAGNGLWKSEVAMDNYDPDRLFSHVVYNVKQVLSSDFDPWTQEFKRIKGMDSNPGVLVMPAIGKHFVDAVSPIFSCNYMGRINGQWLASLFNGEASDFPDSIVRSDGDGFGTSFGMWAQEKINFGDWYYELKRTNSLDQLKYLPRAIDKLISETGPRYLELIAGTDAPPKFYVVQSSPLSIESVQPPKYSCLIGEATEVIGTKVAVSDKIHQMQYWGADPTVENELYNRENRGYILFNPNPIHESFSKEWLKYFSNAAAMIVGSRVNLIAKHLGGFIRQLGIPIIQVDDSRANSQLSSLGGNESGKKIIVYADEFHPSGSRGFVALE